MNVRWASFALNTVLVQAITFVLRPTATYRAIELDVGAEWLGMLGASFALVPLLLAVPLGRTVDRIGEQRVMAAGAALTTLAAVVLLTTADHVGGLLTGFVLLGTGHLGSVVAQQALVANSTEPSRFDRVFGHYTFAASLGQAVGPSLIIVLGGSQAIPRTDGIFAWSLVGCLALVLTTFLAPPSRAARDGRSARGSVRSLLRQRTLLKALAVSCVVQAAVDIALVYLPALGAERDIAAGTIGLLLTVRALASMVSRLFLGSLADLLGRGRLLTISVVVAAVSTSALPLADSTPMLLMIVTLMGFGLGCGQPLTMSWLAEASPPGQRGSAMSLRLTGNRLGQVVLPSLAGAVAAGTGAAGVLVVTGVALGTASLTSRGIGPASSD